MHDASQIFTQLDISSGTVAPTGPAQSPPADVSETNRLLRELAAMQNRTCQLLAELVNQVSLQQRQRAAELKAWKENNPQLARSCRQAAESLSKVHTDFLATVAREAAENAEDFADSEYALGEFIDRYGPRLAHFNGVLQLLAQLGAPQAPAEPPAEG